jgi:uncharacterized membrane protein
MKQRFLTGLVIILPLTITVWFISFFVHLCTRPFEAVTKEFLFSLQLFQNGWWIFTQDQVILFTSTVAIVCGVIAVLFLVGLIGRWFFIRYTLRALESLLSRIPLVNKVYKACRDFTDVLFSSSSSSFSQVVWVPFPSPRQRSIGLVTNEISIQLPNGTERLFTSVLVPGTPNPTVGFSLLYPKQDITNTDVSAHSALKWIISCGSAEADQLMKSSTGLLSKLEQGENSQKSSWFI